MTNKHKSRQCKVCMNQRQEAEFMHTDIVASGVLELLRTKCPSMESSEEVCISCLNHYRAEYVSKLLETEKGELSKLEREVIDSLAEQDTLSANINAEYQSRLSFGERLSDKIAEFGGSWKFIIIFGVVLFSWILFNGLWASSKTFDPFPFILLNLVLSCLAAIQAPIIMMSQNRQEAKDRMRAENDYRVNLKAELEIRHLHMKIDQLLSHQWQRLLEIQQIQMELMNEIGRK